MGPGTNCCAVTEADQRYAHQIYREASEQVFRYLPSPPFLYASPSKQKHILERALLRGVGGEFIRDSRGLQKGGNLSKPRQWLSEDYRIGSDHERDAPEE